MISFDKLEIQLHVPVLCFKEIHWLDDQNRL